MHPVPGTTAGRKCYCCAKTSCRRRLLRLITRSDTLNPALAISAGQAVRCAASVSGTGCWPDAGRARGLRCGLCSEGLSGASTAQEFILANANRPSGAAWIFGPAGTLKRVLNLQDVRQRNAAAVKTHRRLSGPPVGDIGSHIVRQHVGDPIDGMTLPSLCIENFGIYAQVLNFPPMPSMRSGDALRPGKRIFRVGMMIRFRPLPDGEDTLR